MVSTKKSAVTLKDWAQILAMLCKLPVDIVRRILLFGLPGTGKTTFACSLAEQHERITLTPGMFPDALFGKFLLRDGSTWWSPACATRAAEKGCLLVMDEIHKAGSELDSALQSVLDDKTVCKFNLDNGQTVVPADGFRIVATMNGSPDQLQDAVLDRFDIVLKCNTPHPGILKRLSPGGAAYLKNKYDNMPDNDGFTPSVTNRRMITFEGLCNNGIDRELAAEIMFGEGQGKAVLNAIIDAQRNAANESY